MNKTTEQIQQERIDVLNETIDIMNRIIKIDKEHKQHLNKTISNQAKQLESQFKRIEFINTTNDDLIVHLEVIREQKKIDADTIGKLFAAAKKDKEVIKQFKKLINQQGRQIIYLQKENDSLFSESCINKTTLELQKEVKKLSK